MVGPVTEWWNLTCLLRVRGQFAPGQKVGEFLPSANRGITANQTKITLCETETACLFSNQKSGGEIQI